MWRLERAFFLAAGDVPKFDQAIMAASRQGFRVPAESHGPNLRDAALMPSKGMQEFSRRQIPDFGRAIIATSRHSLVIARDSRGEDVIVVCRPFAQLLAGF